MNYFIFDATGGVPPLAGKDVNAKWHFTNGSRKNLKVITQFVITMAFGRIALKYFLKVYFLLSLFCEELVITKN